MKRGARRAVPFFMFQGAVLTIPKPRIGLSISGPADEQFTIADFLGNGAFGEVYRAVGSTSGKVVAVKLLPLGELTDEASVIALMNEVKAALQIVHPNVVQVLHVAEANEELGPYVVMEYVAGGSLAKLLATQKQAAAPIPLPKAFAMMLDIAQGARAINEKLIHRDIKPDNILSDNTHLKIGDFGISKFIDESTRTRTFKGGQHVAYMAPEGWQGTKNTPKLDTYSVGLVFYQIVALAHPFDNVVADAGDWRGWERIHLFEPCPDVRKVRPDVPISIAQLIQRMAAKRPADRPEWDEVLRILTTPTENAPKAQIPAVNAAVEAALKKKQAEDKARLAAEEEARIESKKRELYFHSCGELIASFDPVVQAFNEQYQYGAIRIAGKPGLFDQLRSVTYSIPQGRSITVSFFEHRETGIKLQAGEVIGGAFIGIEQGRGANLVLIRSGADDLYGRWMVCEINLGFVDPRRLIGRFGLRPDTVTPFGFASQGDYYEQIAYARGGLHVFTYHFRQDVQQYFTELLTAACE